MNIEVKGEDVVFSWGERWDQRMTVSVGHQFDRPHITVRGGHSLQVHPHVSNVLHITESRR